MQAFAQNYAQEYDQLYRDKDYRGECDLVEQAFKQYGIGPVRSLVDFGCGTGNHALLLAQRGYRVTGVDLSASMLAWAREKSRRAGVEVRWLEGDLRDVQTPGPVDAALLMFAVLGYLQHNRDITAALKNVRRHLRPGGLLLLDVWYGPAVLAIKPADRSRIVSLPQGQVIRLGTSDLDTRRHICRVHYRLWRLVNGRVAREEEELHTVRYFFPLELELFLNLAGFELLSLTAFPSLERRVDDTTWNALAVARAIESP